MILLLNFLNFLRVKKIYLQQQLKQLLLFIFIFSVFNSLSFLDKSASKPSSLFKLFIFPYLSSITSRFLAISIKIFLTFSPFFAEHSKKLFIISSESRFFSPYSFGTSLLASKSVLFPTNMILSKYVWFYSSSSFNHESIF